MSPTPMSLAIHRHLFLPTVDVIIVTVGLTIAPMRSGYALRTQVDEAGVKPGLNVFFSQVSKYRSVVMHPL